MKRQIAAPLLSAVCAACLLLSVGCRPESPETTQAPSPGAAATAEEASPVRMYFVPSMEAGKVLSDAKVLTAALSKLTGYEYDVQIPTSYAAVIEAMGAGQADAAWLPTFAYVLAHDKYGARVALQVIRYGETSYRGMFVSKVGSGIDSIEDIAGRTVAFTDAASTSGHVYPKAMLREKGLEPSRSLFIGSHPAAMLAVYTGRVDVGCAYYSPPGDDGKLRDARKDLLDRYPDAGEVLQIIGLTDEIPNDTLTFRRDFPQARADRIVKALEDYVASPEGAETLERLYAVTGFRAATDDMYDSVRERLAQAGMAPDEILRALDEKQRGKTQPPATGEESSP